MILISKRIVSYFVYYTKYKLNDMIEVRRVFPPLTRFMSNNHFSISYLDLICLTSVGFLTIRTGILPVRMTDYRYLVIFLHGSTCWLGYDLVPIIQLEKLSSQTRLTTLHLKVIGGNIVRYFSHWLVAICPMDIGDATSTCWDIPGPVVHASIDSSTWFGLFVDFSASWLVVLHEYMDQSQNVHDLDQDALSKVFSVPVHVVSPAPWGCEITQYSHHLFHVFGRRARV